MDKAKALNNYENLRMLKKIYNSTNDNINNLKKNVKKNFINTK
jgi:hypothetical protein